jgi:hypothetical protein
VKRAALGAAAAVRSSWTENALPRTSTSSAQRIALTIIDAPRMVMLDEAMIDSPRVTTPTPPM